MQKEYKSDPIQTRKYLEMNKHNQITTIYYLLEIKIRK